jgi:hypothetical protein
MQGRILIMAASLTPSQRKMIKAAAESAEGVWYPDYAADAADIEALEELGLVYGQPTTRYYWFSNGEPGDEEGFLVTVTDKGRKSYELAKRAGLHSTAA